MDKKESVTSTVTEGSQWSVSQAATGVQVLEYYKQQEEKYCVEIADDIYKPYENLGGDNGATQPSSAKYIGVIFGILLVVTGSINTIAAKWADSVVIEGRKFDHPFFQATVMFVGEFLCLIAYFIVLGIQRFHWKRRHPEYVDELKYVEMRNVVKKSVSDLRSIDSSTSSIPTVPRFNLLLFAIPAVCDVVSTSISYVALNMTSASSYQMLRGAVIIFTGILSMLFLKMKLQLFRWVGMVSVIIGLVIIGVADMIYTPETTADTKHNILIGNTLIIMSQIVVAVQMVVEQKLLGSYGVPALYAVGLEGIFGFIILSLAMIPMFFIHVSETFSTSPGYRLEDALDAFHEMSSSGELVEALCTTVASIAFFNFAGVSVTKYMSATSRMVLDSVRTIIVWGVSIPLFNSQFIPLQILGFFFLVLGMFIYNDVLIMPFIRSLSFYQYIFPSLEQVRKIIGIGKETKVQIDQQSENELDNETNRH